MGWCSDPDGTGPGKPARVTAGEALPLRPSPGGGAGGRRSPPPHMTGAARHMGWCSDPDGTGRAKPAPSTPPRAGGGAEAHHMGWCSDPDGTGASAAHHPIWRAKPAI